MHLTPKNSGICHSDPGSINQAQSQKQWPTESDVLLLGKVNIRHFEGNVDT